MTKRSSGVTLLELVIVIAMIAIVAAILLPTLKHARRAAEDAGSAATLRQLGMALQQYAIEHDGSHPYFATPGDPTTPTHVNGVDMSNTQGSYFLRQSSYWASLILPYFSGNPELEPVPCFRQHTHDGQVHQDVVWSRFWMTCTAFAAPEYWDDDLMAPPDFLLRGTRVTEIRYPSRKGILLDIAGHSFDPRREQEVISSGRIALLLGDGSAGVRNWEPQAPFVHRPYSSMTYPIMGTVDGLQGTDF
jgi:prepilin-type N-terminal cleavage/methylation domain-containing protein